MEKVSEEEIERQHIKDTMSLSEEDFFLREEKGYD